MLLVYGRRSVNETQYHKQEAQTLSSAGCILEGK